MWRSILAMVLLPSLMWSQNPPVQATDPFQDEKPGTEAVGPTYQSFTQMQAIRRGTTERAALLFMLGKENFVSVVSPRNRGGKVIPLKLEFDSSDGISVSAFSFPPDTKTHMTLGNEHVRLLGSNPLPVQFKVRASPDAPLGERVLKGRLTYQLVAGNDLLPSQETEVSLPLTVVEHRARTINSALYKQTFDHDSGVAPLWLWFSLPILIPLILVMLVACGITGQDCRC